ncbi:DMT family transporter [Cellulomonas fimi]|uniref:DMT family transporter n=2 Tax=Cellulomonas fimi TaxID=1708 RepID=A0A7Y0LXD9_CELFI|nr:DMT family transporter [Cellulomonas fimi]
MGGAGVFGRMATPPGAVTGDALTLGRMLAGAVGMLVLLTAGRRLGALRRTRVTPSVVLGGVFLGLSLATYLSATVLIDLSLAVVLHYLGPVVATVLARVLLKERITGPDVVSLALAGVGMTIAAGLVGGAARPAATDGQTLGIVLGATSGVLYGAALLCYRYRSDMPADVRSFWNFAFGAVGVGAMVVVSRPDLSGMTTTHWAWAVGFFLICGLFALSLLVVAGKHLRAAELSSLSYWEIVVASAFGALVFGEPVTGLAVVGAVLVTVAAAVPLVRRPARP